jgi:hypothetical protein
LSVTLSANGFYPRSFRWGGQTVRVLAVDRISTHGAERRFRVRTPIGGFELGLVAEAGVWRVLREPNWLDRAWARVQRMPRYPLPPWRRRAYRVAAPGKVVVTQPVRREGYAGRLALVR